MGPPCSRPKNLLKAPSPNPLVFGVKFSAYKFAGETQTLKPALTTPVYSVDANVFQPALPPLEEAGCSSVHGL